jgi:hypothetical protein
VYSQDNANFFWDNANDRLGIGTSSPLTQLNVPSSILVTSDGGFYGGQAYFASGSWRNAVTGQGGYAIRNTGGAYTVWTGASTSAAGTAFVDFAERMRVTSIGDVLIGSSSGTGAKLNVSGIIRSRTGAATIDFGHDGINGAVASSTNLLMNANGANSLISNTNSVERMRIDASGNVGIGATANASALLDVQSTTKGFRLPNMTTTQKNAISSPAAGLMVFDTTLSKACVYSGSAWETITSL